MFYVDNSKVLMIIVIGLLQLKYFSLSKIHIIDVLLSQSLNVSIIIICCFINHTLNKDATLNHCKIRCLYLCLTYVFAIRLN